MNKDEQRNKSSLRKISHVTMIILAMAVVGCDGKDLTDLEYLERAKVHQSKGELPAGVIELKNALRVNPKNAEARTLLGYIYVQKGDGASAEKELDRALEFGASRSLIIVPMAKAFLMQGKQDTLIEEITVEAGDSPEIAAELYTLRGKAYLLQDNLDRASEAFLAALDRQENSPAARFGQALMYFKQQRWGDARIWISKAIEVSPNLAEAWSLLGDIEGTVRELVKAEEAYSKAVLYERNNAIYLLKRALLRIELNDYKGAEGDIYKIKKISPRLPGIFYAQGMIFLKNKRFQDAQDSFLEALSIDRNYMPAVYYIGVTYYAQKKLEQAESYAKRFIAAFPQSNRAGKLLSAIRLSRDDYIGAESALKSSLNLNENDPWILDHLGNLSLHQGKYRESVDYFEKLVSADSMNSKARLNMGIGLIKDGKKSQGIKAFIDAVDLDPNFQYADLFLIISYIENKEYEEALERAKQFKTKNPGNSMPTNLIGYIYIELGQEALAKEYFNQALELAPGDVLATEQLALLEIKNKHLDRAMQLYKNSLIHNPGHLNILINLAVIEESLGQKDDAKKSLKTAILENPSALQPRMFLANYYLLEGDAKKSLSLLREVQEFYPDHPYLLALIGEAELFNNELFNAVFSFERLVKVQPKSAQANYMLAKALDKRGKVEDRNRIRYHLSEAISVDPTHILAKIAMIRFLAYDGKIVEALVKLQDLKTIYPEHPEVLVLEGWLAMRQNNPKEAVKAYKHALDKIPMSQIAIELAISQWEDGDMQGSILTLESWMQNHENDVVVQYYLADAYLAIGNFEQAIVAFAKVVEQSPDNALALNNLAWLLRNVDPESALLHAKRAFELAPRAAPVLDTLGMLYLSQGNTDQALRLLQNAVDFAPDNLDIRYHLALALERSGDNHGAIKLLRTILAIKKPFSFEDQARLLLQRLTS